MSYFKRALQMTNLSIGANFYLSLTLAPGSSSSILSTTYNHS